MGGWIEWSSRIKVIIIIVIIVAAFVVDVGDAVDVDIDADAYVYVIPEYNYCPPPSFTNALDYVYTEWNYKPCGFVSYGGVSGGLRSAQLAKQLVTTLKMMPMMEGVMVQMPWNLLDENKVFQASEHHEGSGKAMLEELEKWASALQSIRKG